MRLVNYVTSNGTTTSYTEAKKRGIKGVFLTPVDERTPEEKAYAKRHAEKARAIIRRKKAQKRQAAQAVEQEMKEILSSC